MNDPSGTITDFGVSTSILTTTDVSRRWCKLNFGHLWSHVKSRYFSEKIDSRRQYFYLFYTNFLEKSISKKRLGLPFWIMIWLYYYLLNRIRLDLDVDKSCWIPKTPNIATNNQTLPELRKSNLLNLIVLQTA